MPWNGIIQRLRFQKSLLNLAIGALGILLVSLQVHAGPRTAFVHLFEWPWKDVALECENYLGPAGFAAVQVSPPHEHIRTQNSPWWERYQVVSYKLESRSGNEAEFIDMVQRCKKAGVDIYADAILNHMTGMAGGNGLSGTPYSHYDYSPLYSYADFNHCSLNGNDDIQNYSNRYEVQNCELLDLADLATGSEKVRNTLANYLNHLLDLGVTGFRLDAAKHIPAVDLAAIKAKLKRPAYIYQEVIYNPGCPIQYNEYFSVGDVMAYDFPHILARGFQHKDTNSLLHIADGFPASDSSVIFVTNHDLERGGGVLSFNSSQQPLYRLAQIFMMAWPYGYPQIFSGYQFNDMNAGPPVGSDFRTLSVLDSKSLCKAPWTCEHRLPEVAAMVNFRNQTDNTFRVDHWWSNGQDLVAFSRGQNGFVAINFSTNPITRTFSTTMSPGTYCNILEGHCNEHFTVENGFVSVIFPPLSAVVLLKN
ncbi:MAG TPA: alpha-amylase family protein [Pseudobdellovibrionaceae bacterium]|jgi:alpha-amylase